MSQEAIIDRWISERCAFDPTAVTLSTDLYRDYQAWAGGRVHVSSIHLVVRRIARARGVGRWAHPRTRQRGFYGIRLRERDPGDAHDLLPPLDLVQMAEREGHQ